MNKGQKKVRNHTLTVGLIMALLAGGCSSPSPRAPDSDIARAENFSRALSPDAAELAGQSRPWWEYYDDKDLNALIEDALNESPGLNQIRERLEQAAAAARISLADLLPQLDVSGARETERGDTRGPSSFSLRGAAGYELDIWGGNRAKLKADELAAQASLEDVRSAAITLSASLVESWLRLLSLREEEALLKNQIETNEMVLNLQHKRYAHGAAEALDVLQQKESLERTRAQLPDIQAEQEIILHQIAVLAGRNPSLPIALGGSRLPETLAVPQAGIPARLLESRPDIRAAWLRVSSSDWDSEAARINRLPLFNISAVYNTASTKFKNLFDTWALDLALNLAMPIIDGGALRAEQARQEALADERFQSYRETVLKAIGEVEDALSNNHYQVQKIAALEQQLAATRDTLGQAQISYAGGHSDYLSVLNALISTHALEQQLVRARRDLALDRVALYRAIGLRAWTDNIVLTAGPDKITSKARENTDG